MRIVSTNVYVGPSLYAHFPVIRHTLRLGAMEEWPTGRLGQDFVEALLEALPGLREHGCSYGEPGGFVRRMVEEEGTWLGHVWEHVALEIQGLAGHDVTFGRTRSTGVEPDEYHMIYQYRDRQVGLAAGALGLRLLRSLFPEEAAVDAGREPEDADFDWVAERNAFLKLAERTALGPSTQSLVDAAERRGIPWIRVNEYSLIQFGHGRYQRRVQATVTSETRHIAVSIASDKEETRNLLAALGLPVPAQALVYSPEEAIRQAESIGYPVVMKPLDANHGRGVTIGITNAEQVTEGFDTARDHARSRGVLVEQFVEGQDHRMLVVGGRLIAVAKRVPGHVVGDGAHTVAELVDIVNADPRRGVGHEKVLTQLVFDEQAERLLELAGFTRDTVLEDGQLFYLRSTGNLSTGGTSVDLTDQVHPDNRDMAERAIRAIGLDVGGVDFLTSDVTHSYREVGGAIVEVNAAPGFRMHVAPSEGRARDVAGPVLDMLFAPGAPARIPICVITGTNGKTTTARMVSHTLKMAGYTPGMTSTDGVVISGRLTVRGDMTGPTGARIVLRDPTVDAAVLEVARGGLVRAGLGFRRCDVAAVLNVTEDHLGLGGIETLDQLAAVKRIPVEVATDTAVLNADDPRVLAMKRYTRARHVCLVTMRHDNDAVRRHVHDGGRAVVLERGMAGDMITLYDGGRHLPLVWTHLVPATLEGKAWHNVQNAMFAAAVAYALGEGPMRDGPHEVNLDDVRHGLRTFSTSFYEAPGRLNVFDEHPFRVILDYAHNPPAVRAMVDLADRLDVEGRRLIVLAAPGDRRDEDIAAMSTAAAGHFDHYIVRRDDNPRGRATDEIPRMLREGLLAGGVSDDAIEVIPDEVEANARALEISAPGDLLIMLADDVRRSWEQVSGFNEEARGARVAGDGQPESAEDALPDPVYAAAAPVAEVPARPRVRVVHTRPDELFSDEEAD